MGVRSSFFFEGERSVSKKKTYGTSDENAQIRALADRFRTDPDPRKVVKEWLDERYRHIQGGEESKKFALRLLDAIFPDWENEVVKMVGRDT
jgi:hypothetical protein